MGRIDPVEEQDIQRLLIMLGDERVQMKVVELSLKHLKKDDLKEILRPKTEVPKTSINPENKEVPNGEG